MTLVHKLFDTPSYVDSMYLVWINPPINFTFSDDFVFLKKILAGDINSLNLDV